MTTQTRIAILYTTSGDWGGVIWQGMLYDPTGEWMGFLQGRTVFSIDGDYMGYVSDDQRILRKRVLEDDFARPTAKPPARPTARVPMPSSIPLPPRMQELPYALVDMLEEFPERFKEVSNSRQDMD